MSDRLGHSWLMTCLREWNEEQMRGGAEVIQKEKAVVVRDDMEVTLPGGTPAALIGWSVYVLGYPHGGRLYSYDEAVMHCLRCSDWSAESYEEWADRHQALGAKVREEVE